MKKSLLVTRPQYDDGTYYLYHYAGEVIDYAEKKDINVLDLARPRLTRKFFTDLISNKNPSVVFFNAHGGPNCIYGDKINNVEEILVGENTNHKLLNNRIVYARACYTGTSLGVACVEDGGCFIGYTSAFVIYLDGVNYSDPLNDEVAKLFLEPSNLIVISLLKGNTAKRAVEKSANMTMKNIQKLMKNPTEPGALAYVIGLWSNLQGQVIHGDAEMKM